MRAPKIWTRCWPRSSSASRARRSWKRRRSRSRPSAAVNANDGGRKLVDQAVAFYKEAGAGLGVLARTGGGTDAAYAALSGKPVIESLGLPGFGYHSDQAEYVLIDAIPRRLYLGARLIMHSASGE